MRMIFMVLVSLCLAVVCHAQKITPLNVGDSFPNLTFNKIINAPYTSVPYASMKDKVVVLDFFATWCSSCIGFLPHMDSLKKKFEDKLNIFIVSSEAKEKVSTFLEKYLKRYDVELPFITEDSVLYNLFPMRRIPQEVIIKNGMIVGITYPEYLNERNISNILMNKKVKFPLKQDILNYDRSLSIYENNVGSPIELSLFKFLITRSIANMGVSNMVSYDRDSSVKRVTMINHGLLFSIWEAIDGIKYKNRVLFKVGDMNRFFRGNVGLNEWITRYGYCVEYVYPLIWNDHRRKDWLLKQLNLCTGFRIEVKYETVPCWVLIKNEGDLQPNTNDANIVCIGNRIYKNIPELIDVLNGQLIGKPLNPIILDEVKDSSIKNICLNEVDLHDPKAVSTALKPYGLILKPVNRKLKMLVIEDRLTHESVSKHN